MKKLVVLVAVAMLLASGTPAFAAFADPYDGIGAGTTPDSMFYGIDKALDSLSLALTFGNAEKAKKGIEIAQERLMEAKQMAEEDKQKETQLAMDEHRKSIDAAQSELDRIDDGDNPEKSRESMEKVAGIQDRIESHYQKVAEVKDAILERMRDRKTPEQIAKMDVVFSAIKQKALEMETKADAKKEKAKQKYKELSGKNDEDVATEEANVDEGTGLAKGREVRAAKEIQNAEDAVENARQKLKEQKDEGTNVTDFEDELSDIEKEIETAKQSKAQGNNKNARNIAEKIKDFGNEVSAIATRLGDAKKEGTFEQVLEQMKAQIEQRHNESMNEILDNAPEEMKESIRKSIVEAEQRRAGRA